MESVVFRGVIRKKKIKKKSGFSDPKGSEMNPWGRSHSVLPASKAVLRGTAHFCHLWLRVPPSLPSCPSPVPCFSLPGTLLGCFLCSHLLLSDLLVVSPSKQLSVPFQANTVLCVPTSQFCTFAESLLLFLLQFLWFLFHPQLPPLLPKFTAMELKWSNFQYFPKTLSVIFTD